jgi:hypothetical protein
LRNYIHYSRIKPMKSRERERKRERQMGSVKITVSWSIVDERVL